MNVYTFFFEYDGGTYISQIVESSPLGALKAWAKRFDLHTKNAYQQYFEPDLSERLVGSLDLDLLTEVDGLINTWSWGAYKLEKSSALHFTQTAR